MTNIPGADADAIALHDAFAKAIIYNGLGLNEADRLAVKSNMPGDMFQGAGSTIRKISFEILKSRLPGRPAKQDEILEASGLRWSIIDITNRDDIDAWVVIVEAV